MKTKVTEEPTANQGFIIHPLLTQQQLNELERQLVAAAEQKIALQIGYSGLVMENIEFKVTEYIRRLIEDIRTYHNGVLISALYCPDGQRYEWRTDERGAELLRRVMAEQERKFGGEWVDVRVESSAPNALGELLSRHGVRGY
jgi:hypothetical protein